MRSESPFPSPVIPYTSCRGQAKCRAQGAIGERAVRPDIAPPPPREPVRRSSSEKGARQGILVKRKSESQGGGGEGKRRRSSGTESPLVESPSQKAPVIKTSVSSVKSKSPTTTRIRGSMKGTETAKNGTTKGALAGFDEYSDSDSN